MTQATYSEPANVIVENTGNWKVYTKNFLANDWELNEDLQILSVSQTLGNVTGRATFSYQSQDEAKQPNMQIKGYRFHNLLMTGTTMPQNVFVKIQDESLPPPSEIAQTIEPEIIFMGMMMSMSVDLTNNLSAQPLVAVDFAEMLNGLDFFGKRTLNMAGTAVMMYDMLPVFNVNNRGNRSENFADEAYCFDESNLESSANTYKWDADTAIGYLMYWMNNSNLTGSYYDYKVWRQWTNQQNGLAFETTELFDDFIDDIASGGIIGAGINNYRPYNKGCWRAMVDLVEAVGQYTMTLRYKSNNLISVNVVRRAV